MNIFVRGISLLMACVMLVVSGVGDIDVRAENVQQNDVTVDPIEESGSEESESEEIGSEENDLQDDETASETKQVQTIEVEQEITVTVGDTYQVEAVLSGDGELSYDSNDSSIVSIDEKGLLTACAVGETTIGVFASETEMYQQAEVWITVTVVKKNQEIYAEALELYYGEEAKKVVFENPLNSTPVFTVEDAEIAEVDSEGNVTPLRVGETTLTISIAGNNEYNDAELKIAVVVKTTLEKPNLIKAVGSDGKIVICWEKVDGAHGYNLYEKSDAGYSLLAEIDNPDVLEYIREDVSSGKKYSYKIEAYADEKKNISEQSVVKSAKYLLSPVVEMKNLETSIKLKWTEVTGAQGYYLYRKSSVNGTWKSVGKITSGTTLSWTDVSPVNGSNNYYCIKAYYADSIGDSSASKVSYFLKSPSVKSISKKNKSTKMTVKWNKNTKATGYQIQYADNRFFYKAKTVTIRKNSTASKKISRLSKSKKYFVRIRAYKTINGKKYYSAWALSSNVKATKKASYTRLKYKKKTFELRSKAKQYVGGYDTVQGGCSDGKYAYYVLYNRKVEKCKIVKVKLSNMKVMKVSGVLNIDHGNDMTYNKHTKKLIVTHTNVNTKRISVINPTSLKIEKSQDVKIPAKMTGVSDKELKKMKGFAGIAYNAKKKQYVTLLKSTGDLMILNSSFTPVSYIKLTNKSSLTKQGIDVTDDYILISYSGSTNIILVYTWDGQYVSKINVKKGYEIENIYHVGKQYYATFYTSYYKKGKLVRDNYVYKVKGI